MWSIEETKRLKWQNELGWSVTESAEVLERSELDIRNKLISMGLKPIEDDEKPAKTKSRKKRQTVNADIKAEIIQLRKRGYDYKYIGAQTNTSKATIARILKQSGISDANNKEHGNNELAEKCAKLENRILDAETVIKNQAQMISDKNNELYKALRQVEELKEVIDETAEKPKEAADNWSVKELKNVLELLEPLTIDNGADAMTIGEAIGRLKMMISIAYEMERQTKLENVALYIKNLKADAATYKAEKQAFEKRQAAAEKEAESLSKWLKNALDGQRFKTDKTEVSFRKTQRVEVIDIWDLNEDFVKYSDPTPDKAAIKRAIKAGEEVKGAKLIDDISMTVK